MTWWVNKEGVPLFCNFGFELATEARRRAVINGCGPGGWKIDLVPENLLGLSIVDSCNIHDWGYEIGATAEDKAVEDRTFRNNMLRQVEAGTAKNWLARKTLLPLRRALAEKYYQAVSKFGGPAFWDGKDKNKVIIK